jgi:hypothetical protein
MNCLARTLVAVSALLVSGRAAVAQNVPSDTESIEYAHIWCDDGKRDPTDLSVCEVNEDVKQIRVALDVGAGAPRSHTDMLCNEEHEALDKFDVVYAEGWYISYFSRDGKFLGACKLYGRPFNAHPLLQLPQLPKVH